MELLRQHLPAQATAIGCAAFSLVEILRWTARRATSPHRHREHHHRRVRIKAGDRVVMVVRLGQPRPRVIPTPTSSTLPRREVADPFQFRCRRPHHCQGDFLAHKMIYLTVHEAINYSVISSGRAVTACHDLRELAYLAAGPVQAATDPGRWPLSCGLLVATTPAERALPRHPCTPTFTGPVGWWGRG